MKIQNLSVPDCAKALVPQMRDWVKDCSWADIQDDYDVDELTDEQILLGVERFYDGGIDAFVRDNQPANTTLCDSAVRWIPVGQEMPDDEMAVLVATRAGEVWLGYHNGDRWERSDESIISSTVTHWANLPAHPKDMI